MVFNIYMRKCLVLEHFQIKKIKEKRIKSYRKKAKYAYEIEVCMKTGRYLQKKNKINKKAR